jgi:hypothetical protein
MVVWVEQPLLTQALVVEPQVHLLELVVQVEELVFLTMVVELEQLLVELIGHTKLDVSRIRPLVE